MYAKNGRTGKIEFKSDDLSEVLSDILPHGQSIFIMSGTYDAYTPIEIPQPDEIGEYLSSFGWLIQGTSSWRSLERGTIINLHGQDYWWRFEGKVNGYGYQTQTTFKGLTFKGTGIENVFDYVWPTNTGNYPSTRFIDLSFNDINIAIKHAGYWWQLENIFVRNATTQAINIITSPGGMGRARNIVVYNCYSDKYAVEINSGYGGVELEGIDIENFTNGLYLSWRDIIARRLWFEGSDGNGYDLLVQALGCEIDGIFGIPKKIKIGVSDTDSSNIILKFYRVFPSESLEFERVYDARVYLGWYAPSWYPLVNIISGSNIKFYGRGLQNTDTATFSGDGTTTQFTIPHGLVSTPSKVQVTPMSADAAGTFYVTADATNIYVNYTTAPPVGTNNVVLSWYAEV